MLKAHETSGTYLFGEKEKFPRWLSLFMILPIAIVAGLMLMLPTLDAAEKKEMLIALAIVVPLQATLVILFRKARLEKVVTSNGFYFRWLPLQQKFRVIEKDMISNVTLRKAPMHNFGSKWLPGYGRMHLASGGEGLEITMTNRKRIFFSSADPIALSNAVKELIRSNSKTRIREF